MTLTNYTIKEFQNEIDNPAEIARLHLEIREGQVRDYNNEFSNILESQTDLNAIKSFYIEPGGNFFIAHDHASGKIAGFVGLKNNGNKVGEIKRMAVMEEFRRRGVGRALVEAAVLWAKQNGYTQIRLGTGLKEHARPIYESVGFKVLGIRKDINGNAKDYLMELDLVSIETLG